MQHIVGSVLLQQVVDRSPVPTSGQVVPVDQEAVFEFGVQTLVRALVEPLGAARGAR